MVKNDKEYMKEYMKRYIGDSEEIKCECGGKYKAYRKYCHVKTAKHKKHIETSSIIDVRVSDSIEDLKNEISLLKELVKHSISEKFN